MARIFFIKTSLTIFIFFLITNLFSQANKKYIISKFGAKGDGHTINTVFINNTIKQCAENGGGTVIIPKGIFLSSTIYLKSKVNIKLEEGATLLGVNDIDAYNSFIPTSDLSKFSTISTQGNNSNSAYDTMWTKAFIIGQDIDNVTITGNGHINGQHVFNAKGEESMRGPHGIILANAHHIIFKNITIEKAANYAILAYNVKDFNLENVTIREGWDGIHIRGAQNVLVNNCSLQTGDDAIAGGYWKNFSVTNSHINSSCNGMRIIMPVNGFSVKHCNFEGPGKFPHRTSGALHRNNMLAAIYLQPGGWGPKEGDLKNIEILDNQMHNMDSPFAIDLNKGNNAYNITIKNILADNMKEPIYLHSGSTGYFDNIIFDNLDIKFTLKSSSHSRGFDLYNIKNFVSKNVHFQYD